MKTCLDAGIRLTTAEERAEIRTIAEQHLTTLSDADLDALHADRWVAGLEAGLAAHHAGHVPPFKEAVEACFTAGLVKVVFATETLALGINMPARAVVIERMTKFNGERREFLTPAEYTQLTGRAGRRGIDDHGTAIVLWSPFVPFGQIAGLAGSRSFVLRSAFRPTYNMAVNLIRRHDRDIARRLLNQSLAQYQADRAVVVLERRLRTRRQALDSVMVDSRCERGDVAEYRDLTRTAAPRRVRRQRLEQSLARLRPGDVIATPDEARVAVLSVAYRKGGAIRVKVVTPSRHVDVVGMPDFDQPPAVLGAVSCPSPTCPTTATSGPRSPLVWHGCASASATEPATTSSPSTTRSPGVRTPRPTSAPSIGPSGSNARSRSSSAASRPRPAPSACNSSTCSRCWRRGVTWTAGR